MVSRLCPWALAVLLLAPSSALAKKPIVAVFDIQAKAVRVKRSTLRMLSDYLATRLAAAGAYRVIPRSQLKKKLVAQKRKSYKNCYDQSCQIDIGKELAAGRSLATQLMKIGRKCVFTATLYDLRSSTTEKAATARCGCKEDDFVTCIDQVVRKISGKASRPPEKVQDLADPFATKPKKRVHGSLPKEVVRAEIRRHHNKVKACYAAGLRRVPGLNGRVIVEFTISAAGKVVHSVAKRSTLGDMPVELCIARVARSYRFPKPTGGGIVIITYPFVLRPSGAKTAKQPGGGGAAGKGLRRSQIQKVMRGLYKSMRGCFNRHKQVGLYKVQMVVQNDGLVSKAVARGRGAGTPMAACVAAVVQGARFPAFYGQPVTITYPFVFR